MHQRTVLAVHGVLAWARDPVNCRKRLLAILGRSALVVDPQGWIGAHDQKILACLLALMSCARREDCYVTCLKRESASVASSKSRSTAAPCDAEDLVEARMIMGIA